jgi:hypothetical protein
VIALLADVGAVMAHIEHQRHRPGQVRAPERLGLSVCLALVAVCLLALIGVVDAGSDLPRLGLGALAALSGMSVIVQLAAWPWVELERVRVAGRRR